MGELSPTPLVEISDPGARPAAPRPAPAAAPVAEGPYPFLVRAGLVALAVSLFWLALPPVGLAFLALFATAPFLLALRGLEPRPALRVGFVFGSLSAAANAHWLLNVGLPPPVVAGLWLIMGIFPALFAAGYAQAARRGPVALAIVAPALWLALDWIRSEGWHLKFAWFTIGHALAGDRFLVQNADLAGVYGLTLFGFLLSFVLARAVSLGGGKALVLGILLVAVLPTGYSRGNRVLGYAPALTAPIPSDARTLRVVGVQDERPVLVRKLRETENALAAEATPPDVVLWPEGSIDNWRALANRGPLEAIARRTRGAFIFGCSQPSRTPDRPFNAALILGPDAQPIGEYHKRVPVQLLETAVTPGDSSPTFVIGPPPGVRVGIAICYDGTYPFVTRELTRNGAEAILLPTMDLEQWGRIQHAHHALFYPLRACEVRRPILRAASSGVSLALDAWGRELARVEPFGPGFLAATLRPSEVLTPYVQGGWLLPFVALGITLLALAAEIVARVRGGSRPAGPSGGVN